MKLNITIILIFFIFRVSAQSLHENNMRECFSENAELVFTHLNKQVFVGGEKLQYAVYLHALDAEKQNNCSNIIYFEIRNHQNTIVHAWRNSSADLSLKGSTFLPDTLSSGIYTFYAFTNFLRNFNSDLVYKTPIIITPINHTSTKELTYGVSAIERKAKHTANHGKTNSQEIRLTIKKEQFQPGETIKLNLQEASSDSYISASVNEVNPFDSILQEINTNIFIPSITENDIINAIQSVPDNKLYAKETSYFTLSGRVMENNSPLKHELIVASFSDSVIHFDYTFTNENGCFRLFLNEDYDNKVVVLQALNQAYNSSQISWLIDEHKLPFLKTKTTGKAILNSEQNTYLKKSIKAEIVKRVYNELESGEKSPKMKSGSGFYIKPNKIVYPSEFQTLENFQEIVANILPGVRFVKTGDNFRLSIVDEQTQNIYHNNYLVFLDGQPFHNLKYIATLGSTDIDRIEIYNSKIMYGNLNINGILSIFSTHKTIGPSAYSNPYFFYMNQVNAAKHSPNPGTNSKSPAINSHVYWNPAINIKQNSSTSIEFIAPLLSGTYRIDIVGQDIHGKVFSQSKFFKVAKK